jgi:hypothetical protein
MMNLLDTLKGMMLFLHLVSRGCLVVAALAKMPLPALYLGPSAQNARGVVVVPTKTKRQSHGTSQKTSKRGKQEQEVEGRAAKDIMAGTSPLFLPAKISQRFGGNFPVERLGARFGGNFARLADVKHQTSPSIHLRYDTTHTSIQRRCLP